MKRKYLPLALNVKDRDCLVIGSDREANEKAERLVESGARVTRVTSDDFKMSDLKDQFLVMMSIQKDESITKAVAEECRRKRILLCAIDRAQYCDVVNMSLYERGPLKIAIATDGISPALAKKIRLGLERSLKDVPLEDLMADLKELRDRLEKTEADASQRIKKLIEAVEGISFQASMKLPSKKK
jgi:precorrin-2 dehydrogenase / sirohydrochlorin ferrochelatase